MTALKEFVRLESPGIWKSAPDAQRRDVIVSFGKATLVISDSAGRVLSHWSLPAVERISKSPARYRPGEDAVEELELSEELMIDAIARLQEALAKSGQTPWAKGRLWAIGGGVAAVLALAGVVPGALLRQGLDIAPPVVRASVTDALLGEIESLAGKPCDAFGARAGLRTLAEALDLPGGITVISNIIPDVATLPDGRLLVAARVFEDVEHVEAAAGFMAIEKARQVSSDPFRPLLMRASLIHRAQFLTKAELPKDTLRSYGEALLATESEPLSHDETIAALVAAELAAAPYAYAIDPTGETVLPLIESDAGRVTKTLLSDGDWVALQNICGG